MAAAQSPQPQPQPHMPRGRVRISDMQTISQRQIPHTENINFNQPLGHPFPYLYGDVPPLSAPSSTIHTHIPLLREQSSTAAVPIEGQIQDSVVYGNWKPEHPQHPDESAASIERDYGRLEAILMGVHVPPEVAKPLSEEQPAVINSYYSPHAPRDSFEYSQEKHGRRRIPTAKPTIINTEPIQSAEVVRMNSTDPKLKAVAKQINESIETTTPMRSSTTDANWVPIPYPPHSYEVTGPVPSISSPSRATTALSTSTSLLPTTDEEEATTIALNWPSDFLDTSSPKPELMDRIDDVSLVDQNDDYKYFEDTLNSAQMHSELSIPERVPQLPLNITRVGVPYEDQNAADEPTICVPLTVTETSLTDNAAPVLVEVERVYCFPLPKVEVKTGNVSIRQLEDLETNLNATVETLPTDLPSATADASQNTISHMLVLAAFYSWVVARI
ncbi:uncharacterized protein LOC115634801 [Scaptodrosophila lebanonensis]|uniref:Uncharacterized protein LOC115634801 n=1 Tax=Drosophila lebanonensis TaxID=7225 RepID=A0A6J2UK22_DROLE|nr:uncharacterized protein LOC115634801 [Scaptodrosophila lebanonensis]